MIVDQQKEIEILQKKVEQHKPEPEKHKPASFTILFAGLTLMLSFIFLTNLNILACPSK